MARYPQLDIGIHQHHMSSELADMISGSFHFFYMNHRERVMRISGLIKFYNFVLELGELEHTGDWDWRIDVVAIEIGTHGEVKRCALIENAIEETW